jgi:Kelch motif
VFAHTLWDMGLRWRVVLAFVAGVAAAAGCTGPGDPGEPTGSTGSAAGQPQTSTAPPGTSAGGVAADRWSARAAAPVDRSEVAAGALGGRVWVVGGMTSSGEPAAEVVSYDPAADSWREEAALPEAVHHSAAAGDGERLWIAGGYLGQGFGRPADAVWVMAPGGAWERGPALPSPRGAGALAWDGKRLVYGGGVGPDGVSADVFVLAGGAWRRLGELSTAREHLATAADGQGNVWFMAGRTGGLSTNLADVDLVAGDRVARVGAVPTARGGVAGFHAPGRGGCVVGGEQPAGTFGHVECVGADGSTTTLPSLGMARHGLGAVVVDGVAYVVLGGPEPGLSVSNSIEALSVASR